MGVSVSRNSKLMSTLEPSVLTHRSKRAPMTFMVHPYHVNSSSMPNEGFGLDLHEGSLSMILVHIAYIGFTRVLCR